MSRASSYTIRVLAALLLACDTNAAAGARSSGRDVEQILGTGSSISLAIAPLRDTVFANDSARVVVIIRNGGTPATVRNHPSYYRVDVLDPDGRVLEPAVENYEASSLGVEPNVVVPHDGFVGLTFNLECASPPFDPLTTPNRCMWRYALHSAGTYRVVAHYGVPTVSVQGKAAPMPLELSSDTAQFVVVAGKEKH